MKKLILIFAVLAFAVTSQGQMLVKQIGFGAKGVDSIAGGAAAAGTTTYRYINLKETVAAGKVVSTSPITSYSLYSIAAYLTPSVKTSLQPDSAHIWIEFSYDNSTWYKWKNLASSTTMYNFGKPIASGSGTYMTVPVAAPLDCITVTTAGGGCFMPNSCFAPYYRVAFTVFKASTYAYPSVYYSLKPIN